MAPAAAHILRCIRVRQRIKLVSAMAMLLIGAPLTLLGPVIVGTIFWLAAGNFGTRHPWSSLFVASCLLMIPLMFLGESRLRGGALAEANPDRLPGELDHESLSPLPLMASAQFGLLVGLAANPRLAASGLLETFLLGPRLVLDGLRDLCRWWQLRHTSLPRAADLIGQLFIESSAVPLESLLRPGEPIEWLIRVICLLLFGDWIGISKTGYRVWLLTDGRKRLRP
jgi:hypothetical protein